MMRLFCPTRPSVGFAIGLFVLVSSGPGCGTRSTPTPNPDSDARQASVPRSGTLRSNSEAGAKQNSQAEAGTDSPKSEREASFRIFPETFKITADAPGLQLQAFRIGESGDLLDRTRDVRWTIEPPELATVDTAGFVRPTGALAGIATVRASLNNEARTAAITIEKLEKPRWDFAEEIVPIFTKLGCNTGGCHGKADGQNGFHLSLFGYDPEGDYRSVVRDAAQRRISPIAPRQSLLLAKATATVPHGGGPRIRVDSPEYRRILDWIVAGAPEHTVAMPGRVESVRIEPAVIRLERPGSAQVRVLAKSADGSERDVTQLAIYRVLDDGSASVSPTGWVDLKERAETDLIVRYGAQVTSARISTVIHPDLAFDFAKVPRRNFIDDELFKRLEALKVPPSPRASDAVFLRRASLDLTGQQPTPQEIREFLADSAAAKRTKLVDRLLASPDFVLFWRIKLGDLLQISRARHGDSVFRYLTWVDRSLRENKPWDQVVRTLLTALGDPSDIDTGGPVNYAIDSLDPKIQAEQAAQRFLGLRLRCAQCHDHPFDVWTQDDYYGLSAFFAKVQRGGMGAGMMAGRAPVSVNPKGQVLHLRTGKPAQPRLLDHKLVEVADQEDPRRALADWIVAPGNPYFARSMANWTWAQLFGKGIVDPPDDMSRANPPVHPELLAALADHFVREKFNLKELIRAIVLSEAYGLSAGTVPGNERDDRLFSHHVPRPLSAHQMADALAQATDVPNRFVVGDRTISEKERRRAIDLNDPASAGSPILDAFGRCNRTTTCASVASPSLSLRQALLLIGGDLVESKIENLNGYLANALQLEPEPEELVENLYYRTVCRPPTAEERSHWSAELKQASSLREAAEDLFWSLLNSREFAFNH